MVDNVLCFDNVTVGECMKYFFHCVGRIVFIAHFKLNKRNNELKETLTEYECDSNLKREQIQAE